MDNPARRLSHALTFILGLVLFIGGIVTDTAGAWIIGMIVTAVNLQQWQKWNKQQSSHEKE
jgi:UPF0716 family protein affecting phage T7 exclusion